MSMLEVLQSAWQHVPEAKGLAAVAALLILALFLYGLHPLKRWEYRHIPGPPPTWLFGNLLQLMRLGLPQAMQKWAGEYGPVFKVWQGGTVLIVCEDPAGVRAVNMKNHARPPILGGMAGKEKEFDDASLLICSGPLWQSLRQAWQVLFHPSSLRSYTAVMNASAERLVNVLAKKAKAGEQAEMWRLFGCLTMEVICSTALGIDVEALQGDSKAISTDHNAVEFNDTDDDAVQLQKAAAVIFGFSGARVSPYIALRVLFPDVGPLISRVALLLPDPQLRRLLKARKVMQNLCFRLIDKTQRQIQALGMSDADGSASGKHAEDSANAAAAATGDSDGSQPTADLSKLLPQSAQRPDSMFIAQLLQADNKLIGRPFTQIEVASQINTFLLAGYETTASALAFTVYHVAANLDKEAKLLAEIDAFGRDTVPTLEDLDKLPYLEAVFNEALRLSPPAAFGTLRTAREDFELCGYSIRKGYFLNTAQYSFHRNPKYHVDADKFVPERFLTGKGGQTPAFAPFGDGGRSCVGLRFAKAEAKIALIRLYQRFTLRLISNEPLKTRTTITMSPLNGVRVTVQPRA